MQKLGTDHAPAGCSAERAYVSAEKIRFHQGVPRDALGRSPGKAQKDIEEKRNRNQNQVREKQGSCSAEEKRKQNLGGEKGESRSAEEKRKETGTWEVRTRKAVWEKQRGDLKNCFREEDPEVKTGREGRWGTVRKKEREEQGQSAV